jgi:hypothetical protein
MRDRTRLTGCRTSFDKRSRADGRTRSTKCRVVRRQAMGALQLPIPAQGDQDTAPASIRRPEGG